MLQNVRVFFFACMVYVCIFAAYVLDLDFAYFLEGNLGQYPYLFVFRV